MQNHYATTTTQLCDDDTTQEVIRPNLSGLDLPTTLYRIRLCNGDEIFIFEDALQNITGTYYIVQEIEIVDVRQLFQVTDNQGIEQTMTLEQLLLMVLEGDDITVGNYQQNEGSCAPTPPDCNPEEQQDQQNALLQIMGTGFAPRNTDDIDLPTTLQRVLLCDGTEVYLFADELAQIPGTYTILQTIAVTNAQQMFDRGTTITNLDLDDLFSVGLYYAENNPGDNLSTARKNGDISWMTWQTKSRETQSYTFQYDNLNRLTSANHAYIDNLRNYVFNKHYDVSFSYDANGNITNLTRKRMPTDPNDCRIMMDELGYSYDVVNSGNQLLNITDMAEVDKGFKFLNGAGNYQYDANGNLTHDFHKGYVAAYNFLNLPEVFDFGGGKTVDLLYDATGMKLRKTITGSDGNTSSYVKDYCQGIEYRNGVLEAIYHDEGRAISDGNGSFQYEFRLTDHLGNTRVMFADSNRDGEVTEEEIIQENHYYPFGLEMEGDWTSATLPLQPYTYINKEYNDDYGLGLLDYGARYLDPAKGIWNGLDPKAELYQYMSPFNYVGNNPITQYDPNGEFIGTILGGIIGGVAAAIKGEKIWKGVVSGAAAGAVADLVVATGGTGIGVLIVAGAASGATASYVDQRLNGIAHKDVSGSSILKSAVLGGVLGGAFKIAGGVLGRQTAKVITPKGTIEVQGLKAAKVLADDATATGIPDDIFNAVGITSKKVRDEAKKLVANAGGNIEQAAELAIKQNLDASTKKAIEKLLKMQRKLKTMQNRNTISRDDARVLQGQISNDFVETISPPN